MLQPQGWSPVDLPVGMPPLLSVVVDTEEEFDWRAPVSPFNVAVSHIREQPRAHRVFERYGLKPIYLVDFAVASQDEGRAPLRELHAAGLCEIGAHLHPWVNPPFEGPVDVRHSYPGNLPEALERAKLARLGEEIGAAFGLRPVVYRAGRFGVGPATAAILDELGYEIDTSVVPYSDFRSELGPDFGACGQRPYWFGNKRPLLELPLTVGWAGLLSRRGKALHDVVQSPPLRHLHIPGILARLRLFDRIRLSPEGITFDEMRRLTRTLLARGIRAFSLTYHSPSLAPGHTPYVTTTSELEQFLSRIERYLDFFFGDLGGQPTTPLELRDLILRFQNGRAVPVLSGAQALAPAH